MHHRCNVYDDVSPVVGSPLNCVPSMRNDRGCSRERGRRRLLEVNVYTRVSCGSKTEGPRRRNARHRVTLTVPTTPTATRMRTARHSQPPPPQPTPVHGEIPGRERRHAGGALTICPRGVAAAVSLHDCLYLRLFCDADPPGCRYPSNFVAVGKFREGLLVGRAKAGKFCRRFSVFVGGG